MMVINIFISIMIVGLTSLWIPYHRLLKELNHNAQIKQHQSQQTHPKFEHTLPFAELHAN